MIRVFLHLLHQTLHLAGFGQICGDGNGAACDVREGVEGVDGFGAGLGFAGGDEDGAAAGLEEPESILGPLCLER
ncbi:hypothetical protein Tdes44962_MAKER09651 [Teratosphaeria destructans]|uniref:Secreted protein n=1 Tax=Teratosphaeria destructans TaxID=418781 RepID=A0A9W7SSF0_9PEZI|nr:hypothetical protein Tdes44962_MAKER09651 [Teratosphaeria destructans]